MIKKIYNNGMIDTGFIKKCVAMFVKRHSQTKVQDAALYCEMY